MKIVLRNGHDTPLRVAAHSMAPGQDLVVEWTWTGTADLICGPSEITFRTPPGGTVTVSAPDPATVTDLWNSTRRDGTEIHEFRFHNATGEPLNTFWEPWCGEAPAPARAQWTASAAGAGLIYEPGRLVIWDCSGSFRAWAPDGTEIFTGGMPLSHPDPAGQ
ncbi:hypothetical protein [Actinoplanes sp. G11-F43]|uniref:hypothetical protein n=1 Tax=Actinoplanes sp. G11-F43 TaxID=3424130 RepID=UPI003D333657